MRARPLDPTAVDVLQNETETRISVQVRPINHYNDMDRLNRLGVRVSEKADHHVHLLPHTRRPPR